MIIISVEKQLKEQLRCLPVEKQHQVLEFARTLVQAKGHGSCGKDLVKFAGTIDSEDLLAIEKTIHEGCEKVNLGEW